MCIFVYTLPQLCCHPQFQNVCECATAQGAPEAETRSMTLAEPKFLFDTRKGGPETPAYYKARFPCRKRKAVRPVPEMWCTRCLEEKAAAVVVAPVCEAGAFVGPGPGPSRGRDGLVVGSRIGSGSSSGHSSGSSSGGLVTASGSGYSDLTSASGMLLMCGGL